MSTKPDWVPPKTEEITVKDLVIAIRLAVKEDSPVRLLDICKGIDRSEWYSSHLVLRTPGHLLITPVKMGDHWSSLQMRQAT